MVVVLYQSLIDAVANRPVDEMFRRYAPDGRERLVFRRSKLRQEHNEGHAAILAKDFVVNSIKIDV